MRIIIKTIYYIFVAKLFYRIKVIGKKNIPEEGAAIICPNHIHSLDSSLIIASLKRKVNVLAKENLFKNKIAKWFAKIFGIYSIKQNSADIHAIKISLKLLKNNELLMIFPEGTRNGIEKGAKLKNGAVDIAIKAKVPIIPVGIKGSFKPFRKIIINIGKPIYYNDIESIKDKTKINNLTEQLMNNIILLRDN